MSKTIQIGIIGSAGPEEYAYKKPNKAMYKAAEELGSLFAKRRAVVVTGGKGGIMEAACKGTTKAGGITIAEVSGDRRFSANEYVKIEIVTCDVGFRGPSQLVGMCDGIISLGGGAGTLQELCVAYRMSKPVVLLTGFGGWTDKVAKLDYLDERRTVKFEVARNVAESIDKLYNLLPF